jgi:hypothetical protein
MTRQFLFVVKKLFQIEMSFPIVKRNKELIST